MTLKRLRDLLIELCDNADDTELNGHVIIRNVNQHGAELAHVSRTRTMDGKPDGHTYWGLCNIGWKAPTEVRLND
jgi:hypothetical protein